MVYITEGYEPKKALQYFEELSAIPRSSGKEEAAAAYLKKFADDHGFYCRVDDVWNVVIKKPASPGCEHLPAVILQGHSDMVCVKEPDSNHNFDTDPLQLKLVDGILSAEGTTLGADNGVAVAYMLAILDDDTLVHPALECVFTSMEEIGLVGAGKFDAFDLTGKNYINLDSGGDGLFTVSSAGGATYDYHKKPEMKAAEGTALKLSIGGLLGGHSALVIDQKHGNAIKLMTEIIRDMGLVSSVQVASFHGGVKMNAIASDAEAVVVVSDAAAAKKAALETAAIIKARLADSDPGFTFDVAEGCADKVLSADDQNALLRTLSLLPSGMIYMSHDLPGLVTASGNPGIVHADENDLYICMSIRCADDAVRDTMCKELELIADTFGYSTNIVAKFCGWVYDPESKLRTIGMELYKEMYGRDVVIEATHGGMEAGEFSAKLPGIDKVAFCADVKLPHQPEETVSLDSFKRMYDFLVALLEKLSK